MDSNILKSKIPSLDFWAYEKSQSARIHRPEFIDKINQVISWNKDLLLQVTEADTGGVLWKKLFLKILQYSQKSTFAGVTFKLAGLKDWNFIQKWLQRRCFPVNIA